MEFTVTMAILVHLADEKDAEKIRHGGIKIRKNGTGVFCMPVLPNFYVSHQWIRELKRWGAKTFVGVYFKIDSSEMVYAGRFNYEHRRVTLGDAIREIMELEDPLGYELIIDRKIEPKEIANIKHLPQNVGWRYFPGSNRKMPCACEYCLKGTIKGKKLRTRLSLQ
jgi:hypothetical protein